MSKNLALQDPSSKKLHDVNDIILRIKPAKLYWPCTDISYNILSFIFIDILEENQFEVLWVKDLFDQQEFLIFAPQKQKQKP